MNETSNSRISLGLKVDECVKRRVENDIGGRYPYRVLDYHKELGVSNDIPLGNMSFCQVGECRLVSLRQFNYNLGKRDAGCHFFSDFMHDRSYHFFLTDSNFNFVRKVDCDLDNLPMLEDIRLMSYENGIQASGTDISLGSGKHRMTCMDFGFDGKKLSIRDRVVFPVMREKNYIPVEGGRGVFVSDMSAGAIKIVTTSDPSCKQTLGCKGIVQYRGSTQLLRYGIGYAAMVHRRDRHNFFNAFAFFDKALLQCRISDEFTVMKRESPVSFCCGMSIEDGNAVLPVCIHDKTTYLFRLPLQDFLKTAKWR